MQVGTSSKEWVRLREGIPETNCLYSGWLKTHILVAIKILKLTFLIITIFSHIQDAVIKQQDWCEKSGLFSKSHKLIYILFNVLSSLIYTPLHTNFPLFKAVL
jgi:hypothetical protein